MAGVAMSVQRCGRLGRAGPGRCALGLAAGTAWLALLGCKSRVDEAGAGIAMSFAEARADDVFAAPFPGAHLASHDGAPQIAHFPVGGALVVSRLVDLVEQNARGFGATSTIYFVAGEELAAESLPTLEQSLDEGASVFLMDVDEASPDFGRRYPVEVEFRSEARHGGVERMLSVLPLQGVPLREGTLHVAAVTTAVHTDVGEPLATSDVTRALLAGDDVAGVEGASRDDFDDAAAALRELGVDTSRLVALTAFRTGTPTRQLESAVRQLQGEPLPRIEGLELADTYDDYCVYEGAVELPAFQRGSAPFLLSGGEWVWESEQLTRQGTETARVVLTLPRRAPPSRGFPAVVFARAGAGGDRPLVDRGVHDEAGGDAEAGSGPARDLANVGYAALSIDGAHGGLRNPSGSDEQLLVFNYANPVALRDNVRQSALEMTLHARMLSSLSVDASGCEGVGGVATFDVAHVASMGHSMGATITPLAVAFEPAFGAAVFSGAGASYLENIVYKQSPFPVLPTASMFAGLEEGELLERHDPILALLQWALEPADPALYLRYVADEPPSAPRHALTFQGLVDTYIPPPIANAFSLALGVDVLAPPIDASTDVAPSPIAPRLALVGRGEVDAPTRGNRSVAGESVTVVLAQHEEDGIEDGHEIVFQRAEPKAQYRAFLATWLDGVPSVPAP